MDSICARGQEFRKYLKHWLKSSKTSSEKKEEAPLSLEMKTRWSVMFPGLTTQLSGSAQRAKSRVRFSTWKCSRDAVVTAQMLTETLQNVKLWKYQRRAERIHVEPVRNMASKMTSNKRKAYKTETLEAWQNISRHHGTETQC